MTGLTDPGVAERTIRSTPQPLRARRWLILVAPLVSPGSGAIASQLAFLRAALSCPWHLMPPDAGADHALLALVPHHSPTCHAAQKVR